MDISKDGIPFLTPLSLAVQGHQFEIVKLLINSNADPTRKDGSGLAPYDRALLSHSSAVRNKSFLEGSGSKRWVQQLLKRRMQLSSHEQSLRARLSINVGGEKMEALLEDTPHGLLGLRGASLAPLFPGFAGDRLLRLANSTAKRSAPSTAPAASTAERAQADSKEAGASVVPARKGSLLWSTVKSRVLQTKGKLLAATGKQKTASKPNMRQ